MFFTKQKVIYAEAALLRDPSNNYKLVVGTAVRDVSQSDTASALADEVRGNWFTKLRTEWPECHVIDIAVLRYEEPT